MSCQAHREDLSAWLDGELEPARAAELGAHLEGCAACRRAVEALRRADEALRAVPLPEPRPGLRADLERRLAAEARRPARRPHAWIAPRRLATAALAAAAALALYLALPSPVGDPPAPERSAAVPEPMRDPLEAASDEELALALELDTALDLEVIANLELLEAMLALEEDTG